MADKKEDWMANQWRPMMAIMYMIVCIFDFILFPIMFTGVQFWETEASNDAFRQWMPITLGSGGLFHVAMGAVLGVTAWSRGQEKIAGVAGHSNIQSESLDELEKVQPQPRSIQPSREVKVGYGGKMAPPDQPQPLI